MAALPLAPLVLLRMYVLLTGCSAASASGAGATVRVGAAIGQTNARYASYNVDGSWNRGFFHVDWSNANLRAAAASLAPATLRFGGGGNDYIVYDAPPGRCSAAGNADRGPPLPPGYNCLNASHFAAFAGMAEGADAQLIFGASFDKVTACEDGSATQHSSYVWNATNVVAWIRHVQAAGLPVWVRAAALSAFSVLKEAPAQAFELGNEVNNQGVAPDGTPDRHNCSLLPAQQADAIERLAAALEELYPDAAARPKLIGPDTGFRNPQGWLNQTLDRVGHLLHAVTHHVYLGASRKNYNSASMLDRGLHGDISWYVPLVRERAPEAEIWAGEDGPTGGGDSGTCGDPAGAICGLFASSLWYADDMGNRARHGFAQYQRQDLVGARYSLVSMPHDNEFLGERDAVGLTADFWVNFMFKRLIGMQVLNATVAGSASVRAYVHCGPAPSPHRIASTGAAAILINLDNASSTRVTVAGASRLQAWTLSPTLDGGPFGKRVRMNGVLLPDTIADGTAISSVPVAGKRVEGGTLSLLPISVSFVALEGIECKQLKSMGHGS